MKRDFLRGLDLGEGAKLPEAIVDAIMAENGRDIEGLKKANATLTAERDAAKEQLQDAQNTLKSFEGVDLAQVQKDLADWKKRAEDAEASYTAKLAERDFDDALKAKMDGLKFTSAAAKAAVMAEIRGKGLKLDNGVILGFDDAIAAIRERDAEAFLDEDNPPARFTTSMSRAPSGKTYNSAEEIFSIKDAVERQNAIAANPQLFSRKDE